LVGNLKERKIFKPGHRWAGGIRMYSKEREWRDVDLILVA
jgi:hypothetical protein